ncbi:MAG: hypothetical protein ACE5OS_10030 [Anaerolineae bacterium]
MNTKTRRALTLVLSCIGAMAALTLLLSTVSSAKDALPADSPSVPPAPLARPHSPSSGVYTMYDTLTPSDVPTVTYGWVEIHNDADYEWDLGGDFIEDGDISSPYPIGFVFPFYADFYTHFRISENGYIFFEKQGVQVASGSGGMPDLIPNNNLTGTDAVNNFIAPFADDLWGYPGISHVYLRNDSNPRRTIIEFENVVWCCGMYNPRTFQILLYPGGDIKMQYFKITNFAGTLDENLNKSVIVGLENLDGSAGDVYTQGMFIPSATGFWQDQMAIRFQPSFTGVQAVFLPPSQAIWDDPGNSITTTSALYLGASEDVTRSFFLTHSLAVSSSVPITTWANGISYPTFVPPLSGTYTSTLQFVVPIPAAVMDFNDVATVTFTAESTDTVPYVTATFVLNYGPAHRDLQIQKVLDPNIPPAQAGALRYRLVITNTDFADSDRAAIAHGVVVTDLLPTGVTYEDCGRTYWWNSCGSAVTTGTLGAHTVVTLNLGTMGIDEVETVWLELRNGNSSGLVANTAHVTTTQNVELGDGPNNHNSESFTVAGSAVSELYVGKDYPYNNDYVAAGQAIPYNIYFYNNGREGHAGNAPLYDVVITDLLPQNTTFDHATLNYHGPDLLGTEGAITPTIGGPMSRTLVFTAPVVDNGSWNYAILQLWVNVPQTLPIGTLLTNTVAISDGVSSDSDIEVVEIASNYVDPFVDKEPSKDEEGNVIPPEPGKDYTYWILYGNRSMITHATNVVITETLPPSVTLLSASSGRYLTGPVTSTLPSGVTQITWYTDGVPGIPPGGMGRVAVVVHVGSDVPWGAELANQVVVSYTGEFSPSTTVDDTDIVTVEVISEIYGSRKLVDDATPNAGDTIEYTIVVSNASVTDTVSFTVSDVLPAELAYVGHDPPSTGNVVVDDNSILWTGQIITDSKETLAFQATITEAAHIGQSIENTAYITGGTTSIKRSAEITVAQGVFGSSSKTASASEVPSGDPLVYTITVRNNGSIGRAVTVTDSLPPSVTLVGGSFDPTAGDVTLSGDSRVFTWTVSVDPGSERLGFQVTVADGLSDGVTVENVAYLDDGYAPDPIPLSVSVTINNTRTLYLPLVFRNWP